MPRRLLVSLLSLFPLIPSPGRSAEVPAGPRGKTVTLSGEAVPLSQALKAIEEQTGNTVVNGFGAEDPKLKLNLKGATFWQALDAVAEAAGGRVDLYRPDGKVGLDKGRRGEKQPVSYDGIFRIALRRVSGWRDFETGAAGYTATLEVAWEPHFKPYFLETRPQKLELRDAGGKAVPPAAGTSVLVPVDGRIALSFDVPLPALPRSDKEIGLLRGVLPIRGPSKMVTFEFATLKEMAAKQPVSKKQKGATCTVGRPDRPNDSGVTLRPSRWTVQVTTELPPGGPEFESFQAWAWEVNNEIHLLHKDGKTRLESTTNPVRVRFGPRSVTLNYHFEQVEKLRDAAPDSWSVVYRAPASIVEVPIEFSFKNVPLP